MKICYISPTECIRRPLAEIAVGLVNENYDIRIIYPVSKYCPSKDWMASTLIIKTKIDLVKIPSIYVRKIRYDFPNVFKLIVATNKVLKEYDVIHVWAYFYPQVVIPIIYVKLWSIFSKKKVKLILTMDCFVGFSYKPDKPFWMTSAFRFYTKTIGKLLFSIPDLITVYGNNLKKIGEELKIKTPMLVIPTGLNVDKFQNPNEHKITTLTNKYKEKNEKIILFVGMLSTRKGVDKVIEISSKLLYEGINIKMLIVGNSHGPNSFKKLVPEQFKNKIIFVGGSLDIAELMAISDVLLLPSEGEGLPGVVMEAMASGLPVIATNEGCTPDLIKNNFNGFLVEKGDINGYFVKVKELLTNSQLRISFAKRSKERIEDFDWKIIKKKYESIYQS